MKYSPILFATLAFAFAGCDSPEYDNADGIETDAGPDAVLVVPEGDDSELGTTYDPSDEAADAEAEDANEGDSGIFGENPEGDAGTGDDADTDEKDAAMDDEVDVVEEVPTE